MSEIEREVDRALSESPPLIGVRKCGDAEGELVVRMAMGAFVEGNPRTW